MLNMADYYKGWPRFMGAPKLSTQNLNLSTISYSSKSAFQELVYYSSKI